jgi:holo-[acyl-carrier protein] synthase
MRIHGIGIDVVEVERIGSSMAEFGERFAVKIFAAKEAIAKAFGTGIGKELGWLDMEITRKDSGEPALLLSGAGKAYAEANGIAEVKISLSHAHHYAAANAVALGG